MGQGWQQRRRLPALAWARGRLCLGLLVCAWVVGLIAWPAPAQAAQGSWGRAWGEGVSGGRAFGICTVAADCKRGSRGGLGGEMNGASGVATDAAGDVYVADTDSNRIQEFDSSGDWLRAFGADVGGSGVDICTVAASCQGGSSGGLGGEMNAPIGVATDAAGDVYVADATNNRIQEFDSQGNWLRAFGVDVGGSGVDLCTVAASCHAGSSGGLGGEMNDPEGMGTNAAGDVYVADTLNNRIQEFDSSGDWLRAFGADVGGSGVDICTVAASCQGGSSGGLGGEMSAPIGVATDAAGDVYVADYGNLRIQEFDSSGNWLRAFGADVGGSGVDVCTVAASCQAGSSGGLGGEINFPWGVATDAAGDVYVADSNENRIQKFDSEGHWLRAWGKGVNGGSAFGICSVPASCQAGFSGGLGGEMNGVSGVATDAAGDVYAADTLNNRIQEFQDPPYQPDAQIRLASDTSYLGGYLGVGIINTTGAGQTRTITTAPGKSATFDLKFVNAGTHSDTIAVSGCKSSSGFTVKYFKGKTNVTTNVAAGTYKTATLAAGARQVLRLKIAVSSTVTAGKLDTCAVTASSGASPTRQDVVKAKVKAG